MISVRHKSTYRSNLQDNTNNDLECTLDQLFRQFFKKANYQWFVQNNWHWDPMSNKILYLFLTQSQ